MGLLCICRVSIRLELPCNARSNFFRLVNPSYTAVFSYTTPVERVGRTSSLYRWRRAVGRDKNSDVRRATASQKMPCNALDMCSTVLKNARPFFLISQPATSSHVPSHEKSRPKKSLYHLRLLQRTPIIFFFCMSFLFLLSISLPTLPLLPICLAFFSSLSSTMVIQSSGTLPSGFLPL
jgi:hypothetical protein